MVIDMWARIVGDRVAEITDIDPQGRFHPSLVWVECSEDVEPGWTYGGEEFVPPPPVEPESQVPQQVTRAQGKASLIMAGLWQDVLDAVEDIEDPVEKALAEVGLNDATHWERSSPMLNMLATALGISEEDLDDLFIQAHQIQL